MEFQKPQKFDARVSERYFLTENERFLYVRFELVKPDRINFLAGQYVSIKLGKSEERRSYSIATSPDNDHGFALVAEMLPEGKGSQYLKNLKRGDSVEVLAPLGRFTVTQLQSDLPVQADTVAQQKLLFVGTGSGVVPLYAMINDLLINRREMRPLRLHWGVRREEDIFWMDNFERLAEEHPNFVVDIVLSQPSPEWDLCSGHVQDCLKRDFRGGLSGWESYVCGNTKMVEEVAQLLGELGIAEAEIHREKFI